MTTLDAPTPTAGKKWWKSKTLWFNVLVAAGTTPAGAANIHVDSPALATVVAAINVALRAITKQPITE